MKILITNAHSIRNSGDSVLLQVTLQEVKRCFPTSQVVVALNDPDSYIPLGAEIAVGSFVYWFKSTHGERGSWRKLNLLLAPVLLGWAVLVAFSYRLIGRSRCLHPRRGYHRLLQAYLDADLIISCPGNFFVSGSGIGLPLFLAFFSFGYGWIAGKPLYMLQQSIGPFRQRWEYQAAQWLFERVRIIAVRDDRSSQTLVAAGLEEARITMLPDAAFLYQGAGNPLRLLDEIAQVPSTQRPFVGATVIDFAIQNRLFGRQGAYENALVSALIAFVTRHGGTVFLFPQVTGPSQAEDDRIPSRRVSSALRERGVSVVLIDATWSPDELQTAYGQMDIFVGTRLHSNIFALTAGTPVVAIAYFYKTYGIMQMLDLSEWVLDIRTITDQELVQRLELLWQQRATLRRHMGDVLPQLQQEARRACELIRADYDAMRAV
jgi:colanic acid/amylovoran biosynthesis protein